MYPEDFVPFWREGYNWAIRWFRWSRRTLLFEEMDTRRWCNFSDLARRFINRDLFKYIPFDGSIITITELQELFIEGNIDPNYYFVSEAFSDLPYDYDRPGSNRQPIHLLRRNGSIREISSQSLVISSITGINREDYKLYYPKEMILNIENPQTKGSIINLLNELN